MTNELHSTADVSTEVSADGQRINEPSGIQCDQSNLSHGYTQSTNQSPELP